jgi:hypothetical protein
MIPNLLEATNDYWHKLNALEAAYQRGEVSLEEVDQQVKELMAELGQERRRTFSYIFNSLRRTWNQKREVVAGVALLGVATIGWLVIH